MTREVALLADSHGNLRATQAVFDDIDARGIQESYFLGDLVGKGPSGSQVVELVRARCAGVLYGNWDRLITNGHEGFGAPWYRAQLTSEQVHYLRALPGSLRLQMAGRRIYCYHGRFTVPEVVMPNADAESLDRAMTVLGEAEVTVMADAHHPFMLMRGGRMLLNTGSVGIPCDGVSQASYLILRERGEVFSTEQVRVPYDVERAVADALAAPDLPMGKEYVSELRTGRYQRGYNR